VSAANPPAKRKTAYSSLRRIARDIGMKLTVGKPLVVEHVRYVNKPAVDPLEKPLAMARKMGRKDLIERLEQMRRAGR
jgi:hypothetical protein